MNNSTPSLQGNSKDNSADWKQAVKWLLFLGPFFFLSYGSANWLAAQQNEVSHLVFAWEKSIPFVPWTIIPYWSIDFLYALSLFICSSKAELNSHAKRLLTAQVLAVICFILWPMGFTFQRPETTGLFGSLFTALSSFDQPFNQAPSLHIALLVILWVIYPRHLPKILIGPFHLLCFLIGLSVLTTYQHHFIDVPTGALLGWFCVWLWPEDGHFMLSSDSEFNKHEHGLNKKRRYRLAAYYLAAAIFFSTVAFIFNGWALWLLWPAFSVFMVALFYAFIGARGFQKSDNGKMSLASRCLLYPYLLAAKLNSYLWTHSFFARKQSAASQIVEGLWLGRFPSSSEIKQHHYYTIIDMTTEMLIPSIAQSGAVKWHTLPNLDLLTPSEKNLMTAQRLIEQHRNNQTNKPILICCALGYSRSVMAVIVWLVCSQYVENIDEAIALIKNKHPRFVLKKSDYPLLSLYTDKTNDDRMTTDE